MREVEKMSWEKLGNREEGKQSEEGRKKGMKEGRKEGRKEGMKEGRKEGNLVLK